MLRELDCRTDGEDVITLYWDDERDATELELVSCGMRRSRRIPGALAGDALRHPTSTSRRRYWTPPEPGSAAQTSNRAALRLARNAAIGRSVRNSSASAARPRMALNAVMPTCMPSENDSAAVADAVARSA